MKLRSALLAATVLAAPIAAKAEAISGLYIGAGAGANFLQEEKIKSVGFPQAGIPQTAINARGLGSTKIKTDTGFVGLFSVGYGFGNGLRLEVEGNYRDNKLNGIRGSGLQGFTSAGGNEKKYGGMVNVLYDFDPNVLGFANVFGYLPFPVSPYVGVGAGYVWAQDQNVRLRGNPGTIPGFPGGYPELARTNAGQGAFAYQGIVGAAFPIASVPGLAITGEYRFLGLQGDRDYNYQYFAPGVATRAKVRFNEEYNHSVMLGVRYAFNAAPPPPPPAPVAAPVREAARTYLVFFDWDRADLTDRARQIIAEAAQATTRVQVTRIEVSGHTDTSGTARYNQGLSVRRAQNVASELVRLGVPRQAITVQGFGESRPLVPTADGVREPQNRRVEIVLR
jgi:outer membrane protein OmpA-like peptidoglycan-associated protein